MKIDVDGNKTCRNCDNSLIGNLTTLQICDCPVIMDYLQYLETLSSNVSLYEDNYVQIVKAVIFLYGPILFIIDTTSSSSSSSLHQNISIMSTFKY